jgi:hypothetical protein
VLSAGSACSFQNFDYLQKGSDAGPDGTTDMPETGSTDDAHDDAMSATDGPVRDSTVDADAGSIADATKDVWDGYDGYTAPNFVSNPDFNSNYQGWTFVPALAAQNPVAFTQVPQGTGAYTPQGQPYELATYSANAFTVDMSQTITNLTDGEYRYGAWFNCGPNNQMYIYAKGCDADAGMLTANITQTTPTGWVEVVISPVTVVGHRCQVGMYIDAAATNWLNADRFTFEYLGALEAGAADAGADDATTDAADE